MWLALKVVLLLGYAAMQLRSWSMASIVLAAAAVCCKLMALRVTRSLLLTALAYYRIKPAMP
jgi:hypothetical protein